ncbi:MAG: electron transfer flavoprotein subunit beta, partial [Spirochaetia bacterium]
MKTVVCIKQVPGTHEVSIDPETKRLKREGVEAVMNPFDAYALEQAVLLREEHGGEVIALSMGPKKAAVTLREAIACGADKAVLLNSRAFAGSDTWATSYALAMAITQIGDV